MEASRARHNRLLQMMDIGVKLWTKDQLRGAERQLSQRPPVERFESVSMDGIPFRQENPKKARKPYVEYQSWWTLTFGLKEYAPTNATLFAQWEGFMLDEQRTLIETGDLISNVGFLKQAWQYSKTCKAFRAQMKPILQKRRNINKVVCFALGEMMTMIQLPEDYIDREEHQGMLRLHVMDAIVQHFMALTLSEIIREETGNHVRLLAQDPDYSELTKTRLAALGFEVVGDHGAAGFAEVDENTAVVSICPSAPVTQIICDIAFPALFIKEPPGHVNFRTILREADAESPRTLEMWKHYEELDFWVPNRKIESVVLGGLENLVIMAKLDAPFDASNQSRNGADSSSEPTREPSDKGTPLDAVETEANNSLSLAAREGIITSRAGDGVDTIVRPEAAATKAAKRKADIADRDEQMKRIQRVRLDSSRK